MTPWPPYAPVRLRPMTEAYELMAPWSEVCASKSMLK